MRAGGLLREAQRYCGLNDAVLLDVELTVPELIDNRLRITRNMRSNKLIVTAWRMTSDGAHLGDDVEQRPLCGVRLNGLRDGGRELH